MPAEHRDRCAIARALVGALELAKLYARPAVGRLKVHAGIVVAERLGSRCPPAESQCERGKERGEAQIHSVSNTAVRAGKDTA